MAQNIKTKIINEIKNPKNRTFGLVMHNGPDGDSIGSAVALEKTLLKLNKKVDIILQNKVSSNYSSIIGANRVNKIIIPAKRYDLLIVLDCSTPERTIDNLHRFSKNIIVIDHHEGQKPFGNLYLFKKASSTGIIVYDIIKELVEIDEPIATALYLTIRSDTNNFKNSNTDSYSHFVSSKLLLKNANIKLINEIYENRSLSMLRLMGQAFSDIYVDKTYKIVYLTIKNEHIKNANATYEEASMLIDYIRGTEGCDTAFLFLQNYDNVRVKSRSKNINVAEIMKKFNGGGHMYAAGAEIYGSDYYSIVNKVISVTRKYIDDNK